MNRFYKTYIPIIALSLLLLGTLSPSPLADEGCDAEVDASLQTTDKEMGSTRYQFKVDVRTDEGCAKIVYDLIIEEITENGQTKKIRKPRVVKLNDSSLSELVVHKTPESHEMVDYTAKVVSCTPCNMFP